jgi:hypothetical protein
VRSEPKPVLSIAMSTSACLVFVSTRMPATWPARTPATLTSAPLTIPKALSSSIVYAGRFGSSDDPSEAVATAAALAANTTTMTRRRRTRYFPGSVWDASHL